MVASEVYTPPGSETPVITYHLQLNNGESEPGEDYIISNPTFDESKYLILESASEIDPGTPYSGDRTIESVLELKVLSLAERASYSSDYQSSTSLSQGNYPRGGWSRVWLKVDEPQDYEISKTYIIHSKSIDRGDNGKHETFPPAVIRLTIAAGDTQSSKSETLTASEDASEDNGTIQLKPKQGRSGSLLPVELNEVSFGGRADEYHELKSDDLAETYSAPQWVDLDGDGTATNENGEKNQSVAYTRNTSPHIGCKFTISGLSDDINVMIRAKGDDGIEVPETQVSKIYPGSDVYELPVTPGATANGSQRFPTKWPDQVKFYSRHPYNTFSPAFELDWEIKIDSGSWATIGTTKHQVYVTLGVPVKGYAKKNHESLFYIGCNNATGQTETDDVVDKIWEEFTDKKVSRVDPVSGEGTRDPNGMIYWKDGQLAASGVGGPHSLLYHGHDTCGNWSELFIALLQTQGITGQKRIRLTSSNRPSVDYQGAVEAYKKFANFDGNVTYSHNNSSNNQPNIGDRNLSFGTPIFFVKQLSLTEKTFVELPNAGFPNSASKAQGNENAKAWFGDHYIVLHNDKWYDPSYGKGPFEGTNKHTNWEDDSLQFFGASIKAQERVEGIWKDLETLLWVDREDPKGSTETNANISSY